MESGIGVINERVKEESAFVADLKAEMQKVIVGQEYLVERLIVGLLAGEWMLRKRYRLL